MQPHEWFATQVVAALEKSDIDQPAARLQSSSTTTVASPDENTQDSRARKCRKRELAHRDTRNQVHTSKEENRSPLTRLVNNKKLRQPIRERLGHARDEPRALQLVLDALHRARPVHLLDQIAPREGHEAVHQTVLGR